MSDVIAAPPTAAGLRFRAWWSRGLHARPWLHAAAAFVAGLVLPLMLRTGILLLLLGSIPWLLIVVFVIAAAIFGALGWWGTARPAGWWLAVTVIPWFVSEVAVTLSPTTGQGPGGSDVWLYLLAGLVPVALALVSHSGPPRAVAVIAIVAAVAIGVNAKNESDTVQAKLALGSGLRPDVTTVPGYTPYGETQLAYPGTLSEALAWGYIKSGTSTDGYPVQFVLTTDVGTAAVCGSPLYAHQLTQPEPEVQCVQQGKDWMRSSANAYEIVHVGDGKLLRVTAPTSTPKSVLTAALRNAKPMDDRYYRHLLFGQSGQYIPELDGLR